MQVHGLEAPASLSHADEATSWHGKHTTIYTETERWAASHGFSTSGVGFAALNGGYSRPQLCTCTDHPSKRQVRVTGGLRRVLSSCCSATDANGIHITKRLIRPQSAAEALAGVCVTG